MLGGSEYHVAAEAIVAQMGSLQRIVERAGQHLQDPKLAKLARDLDACRDAFGPVAVQLDDAYIRAVQNAAARRFAPEV
jgi:hypothetical protein